MKFFKNECCLIVADIGGNFTDLEDGLALIDAAAKSGVNAIKLQTYKSSTISTKLAFFDMELTGNISQEEYFKKFELCESSHKILFNHMAACGVIGFSTPSHPEDVDLLERYNVPCHKIGADDANNLPFLRYVAATGKPIILSTGMCLLSEVQRAVDAILAVGNEDIILLHTVSGYPTHPENVNLRAMLTLIEAFPAFPVGFSDHTIGPDASLAAATLGARVIERHFTLDRNAEGPDHCISSEPAEMAELVGKIRRMETMMGSSVKRPYGPEILNRRNNRKSLAAMRHIRAGETLTEANVWPKRPGTGLAPECLDRIQGRVAARDIPEDTLLSWSDIQ